MADKISDTLPITIGRYQVLAELGQGSMSMVYKAKDPMFQREVAIKVLPRHMVNDSNYRERFMLEARSIAALEHAAIVPVYDFGEQDGQPYIVMRLMSGGSLRDRMKNGYLPFDEVLRVVERVSNALTAAHAKGMIHRDIRPDNILFDHYNNVYVSDLGVAKLMQATVTSRDNALLGSPQYIAPEVSKGSSELTHLIDIYSLGITLFEMFTNQHPFRADTAVGVLLEHVQAPVPKLRRVRPDLPSGLQAVINKAVAKNPQERYQSASELAQDLRKALTKEAELKPVGTHVFLSYSRENISLLWKVKRDLIATGIEIWTDENLQAGTPAWQDAIEKALDEALCLVVIMTPEAKKSKWVKREIGYAQVTDTRIFPLLALGEEREAVPLPLVNHQWIDIREAKDYEKGIEKLVGSITKAFPRVNNTKKESK